MTTVTEKAWLGQLNEDLVDAGNGHRLHIDVISPFLAMQDAAHKDGIDLQLVSSYRDFDRQTAIFNRKWTGKAQLLDVNGSLLSFDSLRDDEKLHAILTWSALPGGSRHHWGTDIDVYDRASVKHWGGQFNLVETEYEAGGPCYALACWLGENMSRFGWTRNLASSPSCTFMPRRHAGRSAEPWSCPFC